MLSLEKDLQIKKSSLAEFIEITSRVLAYLPNVTSHFETKGSYRIYSSTIAGTTKYVRPLNENLFIFNQSDFLQLSQEFAIIINKIKTRKFTISETESAKINMEVYTIQQAIGAGLDLLVNENSTRKHVGNRFEELIKVIFSEIGVANKKSVLQMPYETNEGTKKYKCEIDLILSPYDAVRSTISSLDKNEIVVSIKTSSKDRMINIFINKILLEKFVMHEQKLIGVFLNDVQRKGKNNISYTFVSGLFMVFTKFLIELQGIYYLDPPPNSKVIPFKNYIKPFSELLVNDIWKLLTP